MSSRATAEGSGSGDVDDVLQPARPGRRRTWHDRTGPGVRHDKRDPPRVVGPEQVERDERRVRGVDGHGVGVRAERGRHRRLVPGFDPHQRRDRAQDAGHPLGGSQQGRGAVLARQAELERLDPCREPGPFPLGLLLVQPQRGDPLVGGGERGRRRLVLRVEPHLTLVQAGDLRLERVEVLLRLRGAGPRPRRPGR